jgi:hypothetical protein
LFSLVDQSDKFDENLQIGSNKSTHFSRNLKLGSEEAIKQHFPYFEAIDFINI